MTAVICYVAKNISIIMCDRRINYGFYQEFGYDDSGEKLVNLSEMGWASGAGISDFLDDFKKRLSTFKRGTTDDIMNIYQSVLATAKKNNPILAEHIDKSVAVASWVTLLTEPPYLLMRLGIFSNNEYLKGQLGFAQYNRIFILYPADYVESPERVNELEDRYELSLEFEGDINKILEKMFLIFDELSESSKYVSRSCDVGIFFIDKNGAHKLKISGEISELITLLENDLIQTKMEVIK